MAALTDKGFVRPTFAALLAAQEARAKELFGEDIDTADTAVLGKFLRIVAYDMAKLYEEMEGVYNARFPHTAEGVNLDRLAPFAGIARNPAVAARFAVRFTGDAGATVPEGFLVATKEGVSFATEAAAKLDAAGAAVCAAVCTEAGVAGNVAAKDICIVVAPVLGILAAEGQTQLTPGAPREADGALRARFATALSGMGAASADAIKAAVLRVAGVSGCTVEENPANTPSATGLPPHSFAAYVLGDGAADAEIAQAIFDKKPIGIASHGAIACEVVDNAGHAHTVRFARVKPLRLWLKATLRVDSRFAQNGAAAAAAALAARVNALGAGEGLVFSSLYAVLHALPGVVEVTGLGLATKAGVFTQQNVAPGPAEAVRLAIGDIALEVAAHAEG